MVFRHLDSSSTADPFCASTRMKPWTSRELARSPPARDRPTGSPARCASIRCSGPPDPARVGGALVTFEPGARTAWHTHPLGQTLIVTAGCGRVQREGGPVEEIRPGDVVWFAPGEKHWHGASPTTAMTHIAIQESARRQGRRLDGARHRRADTAADASDERTLCRRGCKRRSTPLALILAAALSGMVAASAAEDRPLPRQRGEASHNGQAHEDPHQDPGQGHHSHPGRQRTARDFASLLPMTVTGRYARPRRSHLPRNVHAKARESSDPRWDITYYAPGATGDLTGLGTARAHQAGRRVGGEALNVGSRTIGLIGEKRPQ